MLKFEWSPHGLQQVYDGIYEDTVSCGLWSCRFLHCWENGKYFVWFRMVRFGQCLVKVDGHHTAIETPYPAVELECDGYEYHELIELFIKWFLSEDGGDAFHYQAPDGSDRVARTARRTTLATSEACAVAKKIDATFRSRLLSAIRLGAVLRNEPKPKRELK